MTRATQTHFKPGVNAGSPEGLTVPIPLVELIVFKSFKCVFVINIA